MIGASVAEPRRRGRSVLGGQPLTFSAGAASRLSLEVSFEEGALLPDGAELQWVEIEAAQVVRLGRCRFAAPDGKREGAAGRLLFLDEVYDCRSLIRDGRLIDLRGFFQNLPLVLSQRERIRPEFKEHCARVVYDLAVYKRFFDEQDRILDEEPADVAGAAREALLKADGRRFLGFLDEKVRELDALVHDYTYEEHERHGFYLRRLFWPYLMSGKILRRSNLKPQGYAGDAEMMIMVYENSYAGRTVFDQLMHKHAVETAAAEAVRSRRRLVPRVLREVEERVGDPGPDGFHLLSLAAGPACELEEIFRGPGEVGRFNLTLLDQDPVALDLARATVRRIEAARGAALSVRYLQQSVRTVIRSRVLGSVLGRHHFVYSMGLFDYLSAPVARAVLTKIWEVVRPGGTLLAGNFHSSTASRYHMAYWADWSLWYRTEESFLALAEGLEYSSARIDFDETGCQMFLRLEKPA